MTGEVLDCFAFARNDDGKEKTEFLRQWNLRQVRSKITANGERRTANGERRTANGNTDIK
jgi:hypothetical protein